LKYLLDTNTVSEPKRKRPDPAVAAWLHGVDQSSLFISVLTLGEIENGVTKLEPKNRIAADALREWAEGIRAHFSSRIIDIDFAIAETWGRISARRSLPVIDGLLAATALVHGMVFVSRNTRDFSDTGITLLNPWDG